MSTHPARKYTLPIWARVMLVGALGLLAWGGYQLWDNDRRAPGDNAPLVEFRVEGLDCPFWCAVRLTEAIDELDGAEVADWSQSAGTVVVRHDPTRQNIARLTELIEEAGFPVVAVDEAK